MIYVVILFVLMIEMVSAHFMGADAWMMASVTQFEAAVMAGTASVVSSNPKLKRLCLLVALYFFYIAVTDLMTIDYPSWWIGLEAMVLAILCGGILSVPERLPSYQGKNVSLAFYRGSETPVVGSILSLFGLPYSGVALVVDGRMMMPRRKVGKFVKVDLVDISRQWTILGTSFETTSEIKSFFNGLEGTPVTMANCVSAIRPALDILGYQSKLPGNLAMEVLDGG